MEYLHFQMEIHLQIVHFPLLLLVYHECTPPENEQFAPENQPPGTGDSELASQHFLEVKNGSFFGVASALEWGPLQVFLIFIT